MRRKEQVWWVSATVLSLAAFSFFAGLGLRGLFKGLRGIKSDRSAGLLGYQRIASAAPRGIEPDVRPQTLYFEVLRKLQLYYVEQLPTNTQLAYGSIDAMLNSLDDPNSRLLSRTEVEALNAEARGEYPGLGAVLTVKRQTGRLEDEAAAAESDQHVTGQLPSKQTGKPKAPKPAPEGPRGIRTITVVSVAPGGPADKAGLHPGDRITEFDGHWIAPAHVSYRLLTQLTDSLGPQDLRPRDPNEPVEKINPDPRQDSAKKKADEVRERWKNATELPLVMEQLLNPNGGEHELTVERGHPTKSMKVKLAFGTTKVDGVGQRELNPTTGYLHIGAFNGGTAQQVGPALAAFQSSGKKHLVVDLRDSAGGSIEAARDVAGQLLGEVKFAVLQERDAARKMVDRPIMTHGAAKFHPASVTVLVNGGTAGTSELLAAALRDHAGAKLIGSTTFGDGTEQELFTLENGAGFSLTHARMLTSKQVDYDGKGLKADIVPDGDPLNAAVKLLSSAAPTGARRGA